ncbi:hypothetical protein LINPERPRIM_LOCUS33294, partial [Linum perenne]
GNQSFIIAGRRLFTPPVAIIASLHAADIHSVVDSLPADGLLRIEGQEQRFRDEEQKPQG